MCVVDTLDTLSCCSVAVSNSIWIDVAVTITFTAETVNSNTSFWITIVTIDADVTLKPCEGSELRKDLYTTNSMHKLE